MLLKVLILDEFCSILLSLLTTYRKARTKAIADVKNKIIQRQVNIADSTNKAIAKLQTQYDKLDKM